MRTFLSRSVLGAMLVILSHGAALAQAAPATGPVTVRVEGSSATLIPPTLVATKSGPYTPFHKSDPCPGTSAAEALDLATLANGTSWNGTFNTGFGDYLVNSIGGELHPTGSTDGSYWSFWYDHSPAQLGICGQQLNPNDEILFFPDCFGSCPAGFVSPAVLGMTAPAVAQKGSPVAVSVTSYASADGAQSPAVGAVVSGSGASATTTAGGGASLTLPSVGTFTLRATAPNSIRSEPHNICVHDGNDGNCGTPLAPGAPPAGPPAGTPAPPTTSVPCSHQGDDGRCGTVDRTAPRGHLTIVEGTRFAHGHGPRVLSGRVDGDPSGLRDVVLRVTRIVTHRRCEAYNASKRKFVSARCGVANAPAFSVGKSSPFSYLLPAPLSRGRYTVRLAATDGAGNRDAPAPARNEIVFRVD